MKTNWKNIKTAPKDRTEILLLQHRVIIHAKWGGEFHNAFMGVTSLLFVDHATHWMSLPEFPKN